MSFKEIDQGFVKAIVNQTYHDFGKEPEDKAHRALRLYRRAQESKLTKKGKSPRNFP